MMNEEFIKRIYKTIVEEGEKDYGNLLVFISLYFADIAHHHRDRLPADGSFVPLFCKKVSPGTFLAFPR